MLMREYPRWKVTQREDDGVHMVTCTEVDPEHSEGAVAHGKRDEDGLVGPTHIGEAPLSVLCQFNTLLMCRQAQRHW